MTAPGDAGFAVSDRQRPWISLRSPQLQAQVDPLGAQLSVLRDAAGRDLLWDGDPAVWSGRAPLLFPIVGELAGGSYRIGAATYALSRHGFARVRRFDVLAADAGEATFRLAADEATLREYPFRFELDVGFALRGPTLSVTAHIRNTGGTALPASFGFHPAFRWPLPFGHPRASHVIEFPDDEAATIRRLNPRGLLARQAHPTPIVEHRLALDDALFQADAVIFDPVRSRSVTYGAPSGPKLRVSFPDTPCLGVWSKPHANFICIEPWHGIADPEGFAGDFTAKPGVFAVAPGEVKRIEMQISLLQD